MTSAMPDRGGPAEQHEICLAREILDRIGDKWSAYVIAELGEGTRRFSELRKAIPGVSQRMLTVTVRALERDGLLTRQVFPVIPPRVEYTLTPVGRSLLAVVEDLINWSDAHVGDVERARLDYDAAQGLGR